MRFPWRRDPSLSLGWWRYEERERRLVQRASGAALAFEGEAGEAVAPPAGNPATQRWLRFRVTDATESYPLIVEARRLRRGEESLERPSVLRLDHLRSGALWRSETGAAGPPPRPLWLRIDALAIDALSAWPYLADPELDWDWLAIEGGWMGDRWRPELYRSVQRLNRYWQPPVRIEPPAPTTDPAPWRFVPARREMSVNEAQAAIARLRSLERSEIEEALHRLREGQPHLAGVGAFALPLFRNGGDDGFKQAKELWLLADDEIVTDRLLCAREELPGGGHRWHWDFAPISPVGSLNRRSGGYARLPKSPVFTVNRDLAGQSFEPLDLPARCQAHLRALGEASFAWTMAAPVLLDTNGAKPTPFELAPPVESRSKIYFAGDRNRWSWLTTRLSLEGPAEAAEPLAFAFRAPDAAADGPQRLGRFELDAGTPALHDAARGEALVLEESSGWGAGGPAEMRFRWSGSGGSWPMLVSRAVDAHGRDVLAIDQNASAAR